MADWFKLDRLWQNVQALGGRRLAMLASAAVAVVSTVLFASMYLSAPDFETLYSGLSQPDANRIGAALSEAGLAFDVSSDGTKVLVAPRDSARARMYLAEKGLPASATAGYELYDKMGSLGLTSFMQEVTRVRALEGELARSIQTLRGVRAARVHIVMPDRESFRRERVKPSASVVVKLENSNELSSARAIRHLIAAAVPGMGLEQVQVVSTDGTVLAAEGDSASETPVKMIEVERTVSKELQDRVRRTLAPYLGADNIEISVTAKINMDKRQTNETAYDPKSRVERSMRVTKQADNSLNSNNKPVVGVEQNIPGEETGGVPGEQSKRSNERREELTNFEINTKQTTTESLGYRVEQLAVAVLVNRKKLVESLGSTVVAGSLDARLKEVEGLVRTAAGIDNGRGDQVAVTAVDFMQSAGDLDPAPSRSVLELLMAQLGSVIRSITILGVVAMLIMLGLRPMTRMLLEQPGAVPALEGPANAQLALTDPSGAQLPSLPEVSPAAAADAERLEELERAAGRSPTKRLEKIVSLNEEQAAAILRQWLQMSGA